MRLGELHEFHHTPSAFIGHAYVADIARFNMAIENRENIKERLHIVRVIVIISMIAKARNAPVRPMKLIEVDIIRL